MATNWKQIIPPRSIHDEHGLQERRLDTGFYHIRCGFSADPLKDDDWARRHSLTYGGFDAPRWQREHGINYKAYAGQRIWPMLSRDHDAHIDIKDWTVFRVIDQGIRHPTVCMWVAVNKQGDRHFFKEYYSTNRSIAMNCRAILSLSSEKVSGTYIDPSTRKRGAETLKPLIDIYGENKIYCNPADNSFAGYDAITNAALSTLARKALRTGVLPGYFVGLKPDQDQLLDLAQKPALTFDLRFTHRCFEECLNLRWQETKGDETQFAPKEKPVDKDDDGPDCVRYAVQSPLYYKQPLSRIIKIKEYRMFQLDRPKRNELEVLEKQRNRAYI